MGLFSKKRDKGDKVDKESNPYQASTANDSYAPSIASMQSATTVSSPPSYTSSTGLQSNFDQHRRNEKSPVPPGGYGGSTGYRGGNSYADQEGYGAKPYAEASSTRRPGGYGGFGDDSTEIDKKATSSPSPYPTNAHGSLSSQRRDNQPEYKPSSGTQFQRKQDGSTSNYGSGSYGAGGYGSGGYGSEGYGAGGYGSGPGGYGQSQPPTYKPHEDPNATEEEQLGGFRNEIRDIKTQDVQALGRTRMVADAVRAQAQGTLESLRMQHEQLGNSERNLVETQAKVNIAGDNVRTLDALQGMWGKPTSQKDPKKHLENAAQEFNRVQDERGRLNEQKLKRQQRGQQKLDQKSSTSTESGSRSKKNQYILDEDDEEDAELERNIHDGTEDLLYSMKAIKGAAQGISEELDAQNKTLERLGEQTDKVHSKVGDNQRRLDLIAKR